MILFTFWDEMSFHQNVRFGKFKWCQLYEHFVRMRYQKLSSNKLRRKKMAFILIMEYDSESVESSSLQIGW